MSVKELRAKQLKEQQEKYEKYFSQEDKAAAFDRIAEEFYYGNFGSIKSEDFKLLMFSILLDQSLKAGYDSYELSTLLGKKESDIDNLMEKTVVKYPIEFDWKEDFRNQIAKMNSVIYENNYLKINIQNPYTLKKLVQEIEKNAGYVDKQLNKKILSFRPEYLPSLILILSEESERKNIEKEIRAVIKNNFKEHENFEDSLESLVSIIIKDKKTKTFFDILQRMEILINWSPFIGKIISQIN